MPAGKRPARPLKHVPMRMCVGTHTRHAKRDMVRLIVRADGCVVVDPTGKLSGSRGAYISKSFAAAEAALKHKKLEAEFERPISQGDSDAILAYFAQFKQV